MRSMPHSPILGDLARSLLVQLLGEVGMYPGLVFGNAVGGELAIFSKGISG